MKELFGTGIGDRRFSPGIVLSSRTARPRSGVEVHTVSDAAPAALRNDRPDPKTQDQCLNPHLSRCSGINIVAIKDLESIKTENPSKRVFRWRVKMGSVV